MFLKQAEQKQEDDICHGCDHGKFNSLKGLCGGYDCLHPDNHHPDHQPKLVIDVFDKLLKCEFTDRSRPVEESGK